MKALTFLKLNTRCKILIMINILLSLYSYIIFSLFKKKAHFNSIFFIKKKSIDFNLLNDIKTSISIVSKNVPWENVCRHQAFQAKIILSFCKIPYKIFVGFRKDQNGIKIQGHAWTVVEDFTITGSCNPNEYVVQSVFS